jgi:hypothetical protein
MRIGQNLCFARSVIALQLASTSIVIGLDGDDDSLTGDGFGLVQMSSLRHHTNSLELVEVALRIWAGMPWSKIAAYLGYQETAPSQQVDGPSRQAMQQKFGEGVAEVIRRASSHRYGLLAYLGASPVSSGDRLIDPDDERFLPQLIQEALPHLDHHLVFLAIEKHAEVWDLRHGTRTKWWRDDRPNRLY